MISILNQPVLKNSLNECESVWELCRFLGYDFNDISRHAYPNTKKLYKSFTILKKSGGLRVIYSPRRPLRDLQKKIKNELEKLIKYRASAHGFIKEKSIISNAKNHVNKNFVLNLDLEDFFQSIHFGRVAKLFESSPLELPHPVAIFLAHICCRDGVLAIGAPTSPIISNMICYKLDGQLQKLARENRCTYTRYADDITFSFTCLGNKLPRGIVYLESNEPLGFKLGLDLLEIISNNSFKINSNKTRLKNKSQRQEVTGLIVNEKINVKRKFIRKTSSMIHALKTHGAILSEAEYMDKYQSGYIPQRQLKRIESKPGELFIKIIKGRLNYLKMIRGSQCNIWRKLMYDFSVALGKPEEEYKKTWLDDVAELAFIVDTEDSKGSAFVIEDKSGKYVNGLIITNYHVIENIGHDNISNICVHNWIDPNTDFKLLSFIKSDKEIDIAILSAMVPFSQNKYLVLDESFNYKVGSEVYIIGYPDYAKQEEPTITRTKIKGKTSFLNQIRYQVMDEIKHGNSGGPVFNSRGKVIGIASNGNATGSSKNTKSSFIPITTLVDYIETL